MPPTIYLRTGNEAEFYVQIGHIHRKIHCTQIEAYAFNSFNYTN